MAQVQVVVGDITRQRVDAVVNAANERLLGGGGVDGAIHRVAGPALLEACRNLPEVAPGVRCPTGRVRVTPGFDLPARFVVHTVGPVWEGGERAERTLLACCYRAALAAAGAYGLSSIAFPSISTGAYRFPVGEAARVAAESVAGTASVEEVRLVCFSEDDGAVYRSALAAVRS